MSIEGQSVSDLAAFKDAGHLRRVGDLKVFIVAGEHSGDALAGRMMDSLNRKLNKRVRYFGVGGERMRQAGLASQFPLDDVAVMGPLSILPRLPRIVRRVYATVNAAIASEPDVVVIVDSPEFTHAIAKRIRRRRPSLPIVDYVSPSVWAWRPGRARRMKAYVDHILALLPFEPEAHRRLGGPPCTYVGHPLIEKMPWLEKLDPSPLALRLKLDPEKPVLVLLPGSRTSEVSMLFKDFREAIDLVSAWDGAPQVIIPTVPTVRSLIEEGIREWKIPAHVIEGDDDKFRALKLADAALAASGTVTLELAMAGVPGVVAYKVDALAVKLRFLLKVPSIVLANLVAGENVYPEFIQEQCTPVRLGRALAPLLSDSEVRRQQSTRLQDIPRRMRRPGTTPSDSAADIVLHYASNGRQS